MALILENSHVTLGAVTQLNMEREISIACKCAKVEDAEWMRPMSPVTMPLSFSKDRRL